MAEQEPKNVNVLQLILKIFRNPMLRYIVRRIFNACVTMFFIITAVFLLLRMIPKERYIDYMVLNKLPAAVREGYVERIYKEYGLLDPVHIQLLNYYEDIIPIPKTVCVKDKYTEDWKDTICIKKETVLFDFGKSITYKNGKPVMELVAERFPLSFKLNIVALVVMYLIAYPMGVYMAKYKGKIVDKLGNGYIIATIAVPALLYYYFWQIIGMKIFKFPSVFDRESITSWIMPVWAIAFVGIAGTAMWVRRFMVDEINSDYVKFARSKGLGENRIMFTHVLRNAIVPLIRTIPAALIFAIIGSYFVEMLWAIPGSGALLITALTKVDNPLVQALAIIYAALSMAAMLIGDLVTVFFDPRISLTKNK